MDRFEVLSEDFPGLYQSADHCSNRSQNVYFSSLRWYLFLLLLSTLLPFLVPDRTVGTFFSLILFSVTLGILIFIRVKRPDDTWYNGRAVAESVKTISWRWMMRAEPYNNAERIEDVSRDFVEDLKDILFQNESLSHALDIKAGVKEPISQTMKECRLLSASERLEVYKKWRVKDQEEFYSKKAAFNRKRAAQWFWVSVVLHSLAIFLLLYRIIEPSFVFPIEVIATAAGAALTWLQAKKHNELNSAYSLAAHEIALINAESPSIIDEKELSGFVINSEAAFSREHTQWTARRID